MYLLTCLPYSFCSLHKIGLDSLTTLRMQGGQVGVWMCDVWVSIQGYGVQPGCAGLCARAPQLCPTQCDLWTVARLAPLSTGFFRQEYWLGRVAMLSSRGSSLPRNLTHISGISCIAGGFFTHWVSWDACPTRLHVVKWKRAIYSCSAAQTLNDSWTPPANTQRKK